MGFVVFLSKNICIVLNLFRCAQFKEWLSFPLNDGDLYCVNFHNATGKSEAINAP